jgi:hypothetical protein
MTFGRFFLIVLLAGGGYQYWHSHKSRAPDGWRWRSSLTREDTGAGACELVWVERIAVN